MNTFERFVDAIESEDFTTAAQILTQADASVQDRIAEHYSNAAISWLAQEYM